MAYERLVVVGNIGAMDIETSNAGSKYVRMSVAVNRGHGASKSVVWYNVLLFGAMVKDDVKLKTIYTKGRQVLVEGRPQVEAYLKKDGTPALDNTIVATSMPELLDSRPPV
ncbi:MAG: single-stranded DNA-binding protein [Agitococcus sp.]|nr:single-stranded DNA-binding protein [Agitococcus sp.]MDO9177033.1 single-stranded DNA-binding protein [Agitococcus sp.]